MTASKPQIEFATRADREDILRLRSLVWREAGAVGARLATLVDDGHDEHAEHLVLRGHDRAIFAAARVCVHDSVAAGPIPSVFAVPGLQFLSPIGFVFRVVVSPHCRGMGHATGLELKGFARASELGCKMALLVGPEHSARALASIGVRVLGRANLTAWPDLKTQERSIIGRYF